MNPAIDEIVIGKTFIDCFIARDIQAA